MLTPIVMDLVCIFFVELREHGSKSTFVASQESVVSIPRSSWLNMAIIRLCQYHPFFFWNDQEHGLSVSLCFYSKLRIEPFLFSMFQSHQALWEFCVINFKHYGCLRDTLSLWIFRWTLCGMNASYAEKTLTPSITEAEVLSSKSNAAVGNVPFMAVLSL